MSTHCGYIVKVTQLKPHSNADKLQIATFFGNDTCVSLEVHENDIGVYFPSDLQLSEEYCEVNHLCRKKKDGTPDTGYLDENKRNIRAIKLRGERSDGIYMPLESFTYTGVDISTLTVGTPITVVNGHEICQKYIPHKTKKSVAGGAGARVKRCAKRSIAPLFQEHADTEQLAYNLSAFKPGDEIEITLKMHGTSQRTANLPVLTGYADSWHCRLRNKIWFYFNKWTHKNDVETTFAQLKHDGEPIYDWGGVSGTRRVVLDSFDGGFYGSNEFREQHSKTFEGKLWKGETVYYEVVGFTHTGVPIMASADNKKLQDKEFVKQYGAETVFSYGCAPYATEARIEDGEGFYEIPQSDIYVYRITMTNEDGNVVEYTPDFMRYRCEQMGVKTVPVLYRGFIEAVEQEDGAIEYRLVGKNAMDMYGYESAGSLVQTMAECFYDGPDPVGKTHVHEGVVVRILNRPKFTAYKHKNWSFKALEGIVKVEAEAPDMEEAQDGVNG